MGLYLTDMRNIVTVLKVQEMYFRLCIMQPYLSLKLKQLTENNALQSDAQVSSQASSKLVFRIQCETGVQ